MSHILPFSIVVLTAISLIFCAVTTALAFLNLDMVWVNLVAGAATALYHLLIITLAWYRMHSKRTKLVTAATNLSVDPEDHIVIPHPMAITAFGLIILSVWIIAIGITIDIAVKGNDSALAPSLPSHIDQTALIASALVDGAETVIIVFFIWCCLKGQKKSDAQERDKLEENIFNPTTPVLKRMYSQRSARSRRMRHSVAITVAPTTTKYTVLLKSPKPPITRQKVSPWEMLTPGIPTPAPSPNFAKYNTTPLPQTPPLTPLRRPPSTLQLG